MQAKLIAAIAVAAAFAVAVSRAIADDESDRKYIISQIDSKLQSVVGELSGLERKSDERDVDDAQSYMRDVERLVDDLKRVKGSDATAERIVSSYPDYIREFRRSADELKKLKLRQPRASELVRRCKTFDAELVARANATKDDPRGAEELTEYARNHGRNADELMREASREWSEVERNRDDVRRFSASEGRWSDVRRSLHDSAENIARAWRDEWDKAKRECDEAVKGPRHREVERVLDRLASSRAGRADLRNKIDELLSRLQDRVKDVESHSDGSNIRTALSLTKELESHLERLGKAAGDDADSRRIASTWSSWLPALRTALEALEQMKFNQRRSDDGASKCETAQRALQDTVRRYVGDPTLHAQGIVDLPAEADRVGMPIKTGIEKASEVDRSMEDWLRKAKAFDKSEGRWRDVTYNLHSSADRVFQHWRKHFEAMKKACEYLVQGKDQPDVKRAVDEMMRDTSAAGENYRKLRDEFNRWKAEVNKLREFSAQDLEEIRREMCNMLDHDDLKSVNAVANRWAAQISSVYGSIMGSGDRIKRAADDLIAKKRALKAAPKAKDSVDAILESISKIKDRQLLGSNNPALIARSQYGTSMHKSMQTGCDAREVVVKASYCDNPHPERRDCVIDCIRGCKIVEIKPANSRAEALGKEQVAAYVVGVKRMYASLGDAMFDGKLTVLRGCVDRVKNELVVASDVEKYDFCPKAEELGAVPGEVAAELPEVPQ